MRAYKMWIITTSMIFIESLFNFFVGEILVGITFLLFTIILVCAVMTMKYLEDKK